MPRVNAKEHWKINVPVDDWYNIADPWGVAHKPSEIAKAAAISQIVSRQMHNGMLLDIGCGEGHFTNLYHRHYNVTLGCDLSHKAINRAYEKYGRNCVFVQWNIKKGIPNLKGKIDTIVCSEMLYYVYPKDLDKVTKNIMKMMKKRGMLVVCVSRYYTEEEIKAMFNLEWCETEKMGETVIVYGRKV